MENSISTAEMISLTIYLTLLKQNIESNPGMENKSRNNFSIMTYNCNGLGNQKKLRRLLVKLAPMVNKGCIVLLQETHIKDVSYLKTVWKYKYISNCISTNSAGVITLYNNDYETIETYSDKEGRHTIVVLENEQSKFIVSNAYFPNDHKIGINFAETVYLKILEFQHTYPEHDTISGGDYNLCMTEHD
jgi:exonuclease III